MELDNKVCVITGGASGIGAATARAFVKHGARVVIADLNEQGARSVASEIGALALACDVSQEADVNRLVAETEQSYGPVDLFFSNAGIGTGGGPLETPLDEWQRQWDSNVMSQVYAVRAVLPGMLERGSGYLVHTGSMAGILASNGNLTYTVSKHAVVGLAEWLAITYHDKGVRTSLLSPLGVKTPMLAEAESEYLRGGGGSTPKEPEEVAQMVVDGIREERFLILTDAVAQQWIERKAVDLDRWLRGMRRLQARIEAAE